MKIDYNMITAVLALISSLIAIYAIANESKRSRFALGMDLLFKINDQFSSPAFSRNRKVAAKFLLKSKAESDYKRSTCDELDSILDFFQTIASLLERGILDKAILWEYYSYWLLNYFEASKEYIKFIQRDDPLIWEGVVSLNKTFVKIESKERKHTIKVYTPPSQVEIKQFLIEESKLDIRE